MKKSSSMKGIKKRSEIKKKSDIPTPTVAKKWAWAQDAEWCSVPADYRDPTPPVPIPTKEEIEMHEKKKQQRQRQQSQGQRDHPFYTSLQDVDPSHEKRATGRPAIYGQPTAHFSETQKKKLKGLDKYGFAEEDYIPSKEDEEAFPEQAPITIVGGGGKNIYGGHESGDDSEEEDIGRDFMAVKPWIGSMYPPEEYIKWSGQDPKTYKLGVSPGVFSEDRNNWSEPEIDFDLDYIFGYRARDCRDNLHWVDEKHVVFHAAAVGIVLDLETTDQDFYFGHDDDIVCMDYHPQTKMVASGSIGAQRTVRLCLWQVDLELEEFPTLHCIQGFHQFAVLSVAFNPPGTIVCSVGMDEHHSVALYSVRDGTLLACCEADKSRLLFTKFNTAASVNSHTCFVTLGHKHFTFWEPADNTMKPSKNGENNYYFKVSEDVPVSQRLIYQRGFGCEELNTEGFVFYSVDFSEFHALVGASNGCVYMFDAATYDMKRKLSLCDKRILSIRCMDPFQEQCPTFAIGSGDGMIRFFDITGAGAGQDPDIKPNKTVLPSGDNQLNMNLLDEATDNASDTLVNSVRSMCIDVNTNKLLVGTILHTIYSVDLNKSTLEAPKAHVLLAGHWCPLLNNAEAHGELWGIDTHPYKQHVITCMEDQTIRLWDLVDNLELARRHTPYRGYKCSFAQDGSMIAVGYKNGSFSVFTPDLKDWLWPNYKGRQGRVSDIQFSPDSTKLAVAADMSIDVYEIVRIENNYRGEKTEYGGIEIKKIGICRGHSATVLSFDWNISSNCIQACNCGYEVLYWSIPECRRLVGVKALANEDWFTQTCIIGWAVQGMWPKFADGTDINACAKSRSHKYLTTVDDDGMVKLFNFPCVGSGLDKTGNVKIKPKFREFEGHSSHVTNCIWTYDDTYCCTTGGGDLTFFCWKVNYGENDKLKPAVFHNASMVDEIKANVARAKDMFAGRAKAGQKGSWAGVMKKNQQAGPQSPTKAPTPSSSSEAVKPQGSSIFKSVAPPAGDGSKASDPVPPGTVAGKVEEKNKDTTMLSMFTNQTSSLLKSIFGGGRTHVTTDDITSEKPSNCWMCDFGYPDQDMAKCPRCRAWRVRRLKPLTKAWVGRKTFLKDTMRNGSRILRPTNAFAQNTKATQRQRHEWQCKVPEKVFKPPGQREQQKPKIGLDISDSDEDDVATRIMMETFGANSGKAVKKSKKSKEQKKKAPKTNGPDFADL